MIAIVAFCLGFVLSGFVAGWAGMWKRPAKECRICELRAAVEEKVVEPPLWYDFAKGWVIFRIIRGSRAISKWFMRELWGTLLIPIAASLIFFFARHCEQVSGRYLDTAKIWCKSHNCEAIECNSGTDTCEIRWLDDNKTYTVDCRGHGCSFK